MRIVPLLRAGLPATILTLLPAAAHSQTFAGPATVVSEWQAQDRGDGSGSYLLDTAVTGPSGVTLEHVLASERGADGIQTDDESFRVLEGERETARAGSDPTDLGPAYGQAAIAWTLPFDLDFDPTPKRTYRPRDKEVRKLVRGVVEGAKVSIRVASDGRTMADVQVPETLPADELAQRFVGIRDAIRDADYGLAHLKITGTATAPGSLASE